MRTGVYVCWSPNESGYVWRVVLDLILPGGNGLGLLLDIRKKRNQVGVIIVSAKDSLDDKVKGLEIGADDYLAKPIEIDKLLRKIVKALKKKWKMSDKKSAI